VFSVHDVGVMKKIIKHCIESSFRPTFKLTSGTCRKLIVYGDSMSIHSVNAWTLFCLLVTQSVEILIVDPAFRLMYNHLLPV